MLFSVIIPVYNKSKIIQICVDSVLNQNFNDYELLVIDDGSTDESIEKIKVRENVIVLRKENGGVSSARNYGVINSKGEYICFLDADDYWEPEHLSTLYEMIVQYPSEKMFSTSHRIRQLNGQIEWNDILSAYDSSIILVDDLFELWLRKKSKRIICSDTVCIKREVFDEVGLFEEGVSQGEDTDMWFRIAAYYKVVLSKKLTATYQREFSDATKYYKNNYEWIFASREDDLVNDFRIPEEKRKNIVKYIDRYRMNNCRSMLFENNRKKAREYLKDVKYKADLRYIITLLCLICPDCIYRPLFRKMLGGMYADI